MRYKLLDESNGRKTFAIVFSEGDEFLRLLAAFAYEERLTASQFTAIGAFHDVRLGFFEVVKNDYKIIPFREQLEVLTLNGIISGEPGATPSVHAHVVLGAVAGRALGGHLLEGHVRPTLEVILTESPAYLRRIRDPKSGLFLLDLTP